MWYPYWKYWMDLWKQDTKTMQVKPIFEERTFSVNKRLVGVLMPFHEPFEALYEDHIKPFLEKDMKFKVQRADNKFVQWYGERTQSVLSSAVPLSTVPSSAVLSSADWEKIIPSATTTIDPSAKRAIDRDTHDVRVRPVMEEVWILLNQSHFLIADVTGKNPNVFYELGVAHTIGKYVIIISQKGEDVPFDIGHLRYIPYQYNEEGTKTLLKMIKERIENMFGEEIH